VRPYHPSFDQQSSLADARVQHRSREYALSPTDQVGLAAIYFLVLENVIWFSQRKSARLRIAVKCVSREGLAKDNMYLQATDWKSSSISVVTLILVNQTAEGRGSVKGGRLADFIATSAMPYKASKVGPPSCTTVTADTNMLALQAHSTMGEA
jgi:hypothetical protein